MTKQDLGEWLVYEKAIIIADIDKYIRKFMNNAVLTPFTETKYISDLKNEVFEHVLVEVQKHHPYVDAELILHLMCETEISTIIEKHYLREWLYD